MSYIRFLIILNSVIIMINLEMTASPAVGKKIELEQSIVYFQEHLKENSPQFEVVVVYEENYQFTFKLKTEEEVQKLLESNSFILLSGAIQTLCKKPLVTLNGKKITLKNLTNT